MKPIIAGFCALMLIAFSCQNADHEALETTQQQLEANLQMYERVWDDIVNKKQIDQINEEHFDNQVIMVTSPENIVGIDGFKAYYNNYLTGFSEVTFTILDAFGQGDKIVKHWRFQGKHTGEFFGIPPTGNTVNVEGVTLVKMKDGKIAQEQDFLDNLVFYQQLGLSE
ncbi:MAG: ester cyclase [Saprospiraceae bacterium]|nr:ester cyclase [Saprospiraceae bacterium]HPG07060.1 ester cyclase [Saprospiraceae bacterium]